MQLDVAFVTPPKVTKVQQHSRQGLHHDRAAQVSGSIFSDDHQAQALRDMQDSSAPLRAPIGVAAVPCWTDTRDTDLVVVVNPTERTLNRLPVEQRLGRLRGDVPASAVMLAQKLSNILSSDDNVRMIRVILNELMFEEVATARHLALSLVRERVYLPHVHVRLDPPIIPRPERALIDDRQCQRRPDQILQVLASIT
ncbi:hypothetical protein EV121DRAFT_296784 [Schizophyllum commune]